MPHEFRHIRTSMRGVRDDVYMTMSELDGYGFSYHESQITIMIVGKILFKRNCKLPVGSAELESDIFKDKEEEVIDGNKYDNNTTYKACH